MYGTVARLRVKPGAEGELERLGKSFTEADLPPGMVAEYVYRSDSDPQEYTLAVVFTSEEAYKANAVSPEQNARYERLIAYLAAEPEWRGGTIVLAYPR
jgi:quinol monooxygenase YgiN